MRIRTKLILSTGIATASMALLHCVGDEPTTSEPGADAGSDATSIDDSSSPVGDSSSIVDGGADASLCVNSAVTCAGADPCIIQINGGGQNFCARDNKCNVYCWGDNRDGQLATDPTKTLFSATPKQIDLGGKLAGGVDVAGPENVTTTGYTVVCARVTTTAGTPLTVECWGGAEFGQIGVYPDASIVSVNDAGRHYVDTPTEIPGIVGSAYIAAGQTRECSISGLNALECWGDNHFGELARDSGGVATNPVPGLAMFADGPGTPISVSIGYQFLCTINAGSSPANRVACVGHNDFGQLGRGDAAPDQSALTEILPATYANRIAAGKYSACAIDVHGAVYCWGDNSVGESATGSLSPPSFGNPNAVPTITSTTTPAFALQAGINSFCALLVVADPGDGAVAQNVYCWGQNDSGQAIPNGPNPVLSPTPVVGLPKRAAAVAVGAQASCALMTDGTVYCWGENYVGELGNGDPGDARISGPVKVTF